ncbi:MAG TPA: hypothetical protein VM694_06345 [Polyangium sp.]|nr:hypothetical protein [Polyangium sp.]
MRSKGTAGPTTTLATPWGEAPLAVDAELNRAVFHLHDDVHRFDAALRDGRRR